LRVLNLGQLFVPGKAGTPMSDGGKREPILRLVCQRKWFLACVYVPLAVCCSVAAYQAGRVETWLWLESNGGRMSYAAQREIAHNLLWLKADVDAYQKKHGKLPARLADVDLAQFREHGEPLRLDAQGQPLDPWGRPFLYAVKAGEVDLRSLGRDGLPGGTRLDMDVSLDLRTWDYDLPGLSEYLRYQSDMPERSEAPAIQWFCAFCPPVIFVTALYRRLRGRSRLHAVFWVPSVTVVALFAGVMGGPILFVLMLVYVIVNALLGMFLGVLWLIIAYWFGFPVPPMSDH
jgi:hypothetical protein